MPAEDAHEDQRALSPELVLVSSPEETKDARARLPQSPWKSSSSSEQPAPENDAEAGHRSKSRSRKGLVAVLVVLAAIGLGAVGYVAVSHSRDSGSSTAPSTFVPSHTWAWAPAQGATAYDVTFVRNGQVVFRTRASEPRIVLPQSFRFEPGSYRWTVRALPITAGGPAIVDSTFSLTAAGATEANDSSR